ncbi:hypothetical protein J6590_038828 [Homalodisca vitripennis]|nr:hypothetical protein J6590_038828 [Homalodisca vitripennis]
MPSQRSSSSDLETDSFVLEYRWRFDTRSGEWEHCFRVRVRAQRPVFIQGMSTTLFPCTMNGAQCLHKIQTPFKL